MALETISGVPDKRVRRMVIKDKRNKSGVVGVSKTIKKTRTGKKWGVLSGYMVAQAR